jgi:hypothetical protein
VSRSTRGTNPQVGKILTYDQGPSPLMAVSFDRASSSVASPPRRNVSKRVQSRYVISIMHFYFAFESRQEPLVRPSRCHPPLSRESDWAKSWTYPPPSHQLHEADDRTFCGRRRRRVAAQLLCIRATRMFCRHPYRGTEDAWRDG